MDFLTVGIMVHICEFTVLVMTTVTDGAPLICYLYGSASSNSQYIPRLVCQKESMLQQGQGVPHFTFWSEADHGNGLLHSLHM